MFDWNEFLDLAEHLTREPAGEAALRSAISRAYYAAYHAAASFVRAEGLLTTGHTHARVWAVLSSSPDFAHAEVGGKGERLKTLRVDADYRNPFPGDPGRIAREAVITARDVVDAIDRLSSPDRGNAAVVR